MYLVCGFPILTIQKTFNFTFQIAIIEFIRNEVAIFSNERRLLRSEIAC